MASKQNNYSTDSTGTAFLSQQPQRISLSSPILASSLDLPPQPRISYSVYNVATDPAAPAAAEQLERIEQARRRIWQENESRPITDALFPSVRITRDALVLYVFALGSGEAPLVGETAMQNLTLDGLNRVEASSFAVAGLYPCSASCAGQVDPCPACIKVTDGTFTGAHASASQPSSACLLPRTSLRRLLTQFLEALRDRLIEDVTRSGPAKQDRGRSAVRLNDGFLLKPLFTSSPNEWGTGWDHRSIQRTLVHCQLQLQLTSSRILIHPILRPTCYLPLSTVLPLPVGTPIVLLPHGVTAYYLNTYTGPVGGLTAQFDAALQGLGAGHWKVPDSAKTSDPGSRPGLSYVIVWLAVQNKQGEDKGVRAIWPTNLCAAFSPSAPHIPPPLAYIPDLPAQLQASPPVAPHVPAVANAKPSLRALTPSVSASSIPSPVTDNHLAPSLHSRQGTPKLAEARPDIATLTPKRRRPFPSSHSPTSDTLRAFKTLTLVNRDIRQIAGDVSGYVDTVAKEREKERERLRREREGHSSRSLSSPLKPEEKPNAPRHQKSTPVPVLNIPITPAQVALRNAPVSLTPANIASETPSAAHIPNTVTNNMPTAPDNTGLLPAADIVSPSSHEPLPMEVSPSADIVQSTGRSVPPPTIADAGISFENFGSFDNGWAQGSGEFMNLDINMDNFDYPMSIDGDDGGTFGVDGTFSFTDDDFNIFDERPAASVSVITTGVPAPLSAIDTNMNATGPGPPLGVAQGLPWMSHGAAESFTPRSLDTPGAIPPPPDLMPSTPTLTPPSHSLPVTPTVLLADQPRPGHGRNNSAGSSTMSMFDPIPFAEAHKLSDGKYSTGKFALPTPPDEEDRTHPIPIRHPFPRRAGVDWKSSYEAATDPRVGIIRMLKRKRCQKEDAGRKASPAWMSEREEWMSSSYGAIPDADNDDTLSASEDEDEEDELEDQDVEVAARAHTPPPSYLPIGPSLIATHFSHTYLLPICSPLRPPGVVTSGPIGPMSVPTPVSPAAILGDSSAKSKSLEDSVQILVKELVENSVWELSWRASALISYTAKKAASGLWQLDVQHVHQLLYSLGSLDTTMDLRTSFSDEKVGSIASMQELDEPLLAVGKSDTIIQVLPSALRFWDKLGLTPRAGKKDLNAFVLYDGEDKEQQLASWLNKVSVAYEV
ncbi:hypothetical protein EIP86_010351 [Pleurotus ostreatoroseus]|nr:hypothetical protein EIP86_010351 [Pleurotus ostreatoroseus]